MDNPEIWASLIEPGFEHYEVNQIGRVRNKNTMKLLAQSKNGKYIRHVLRKNDGSDGYFFAHQLVALTFIPKPDDYDDKKTTVDHIDRNPLNNNLSNLRWANKSEQVINRGQRKEGQKTGQYPCWRLDPETLQELEFYDSLKAAAKWVFDNKLSKTDEFDKLGESSIRTNIRRIAVEYDEETGKFKSNVSAFKYKWKYANIVGPCCENETWQPVNPVIKNSHDFIVSTCGRVRNASGKYSTIAISPAGYLSTTIRGDSHFIHRLVAITFIQNNNQTINIIVNHKDGDKQNAHVGNLEWCNRHENAQHAIVNDLCGRVNKLIQYNMAGEFVCEYNHSLHAGEVLGCDRKKISLCCQNKEYSYNNMRFQYKYKDVRDKHAAGQFYETNLVEIKYDEINVVIDVEELAQLADE
jgi:hypothetical protein